MRSHRTDSVSLFFGLAFLMISLGYLAKVYLDLDLPSMGWFIAAGLVFLGIVGAVTALIPSRQAAIPAGEQEAGPQETEEPEQFEQRHEDTDTDTDQAR